MRLRATLLSYLLSRAHNHLVLEIYRPKQGMSQRWAAMLIDLCRPLLYNLCSSRYHSNTSTAKLSEFPFWICVLLFGSELKRFLCWRGLLRWCLMFFTWVRQVFPEVKARVRHNYPPEVWDPNQIIIKKRKLTKLYLLRSWVWQITPHYLQFSR